MDIKKKHIYAIIGFLILVIGIFTIYAAIDTDKAWHSPNEILVTVDNYTMTLQNATDNNVFIDGATQSFTTEIPNPGHNASEIWVSVNGDEMTLQNAILTTGLCGNSTTPYSSTPISLVYQFASEIEVIVDSSTMDLQDAIDSGEFCCVENYGDSCPLGNLSCINVGNITCDGLCTGSYKSQGTSCGTGVECDGNGNCVLVCQEGYYDTWAGTCTNFCATKACNTAQVYGAPGSSLAGCSICWGGITSGPHSGDFNDCDIIQSGWIPICATECFCSDV